MKFYRMCHFQCPFRHFSQRQEVLQSFRQVQLLVSDSDVESYKQIKADLDVLRQSVEKSELWVYKAKSDEHGTGELRPLKHTTISNATKSQEIRKTKKRKTTPHHQNLLC